MVDANITDVFVGIETPNDAALLGDPQDPDSARPHGTMPKKSTVSSIRDLNLVRYYCRFRQPTHSGVLPRLQRRFFQDPISSNLCGNMLVAIPNTPPALRPLRAENCRLEPFRGSFRRGTMSFRTRCILIAAAASLALMPRTIYDPAAYFRRLIRSYLVPRMRRGAPARVICGAIAAVVIANARSLAESWRSSGELNAPRRGYLFARHTVRRLWRAARVARDPRLWLQIYR